MDVFREDGLLALWNTSLPQKFKTLEHSHKQAEVDRFEEANTLRQAPRSRTYPDDSSWVSSRSDRLETEFVPVKVVSTHDSRFLSRSVESAVHHASDCNASCGSAVIASRVTALRQEVMGRS